MTKRLVLLVALAVLVGSCDGDPDDPPVCGDGIQQASEECDEGGDTAACDADCTLVACDDGHINAAAGEQCEDGDPDDTAACDADCTLVVCDDGHVNAAAGEQCEDGDPEATAICDADCTLVMCGDGHVNGAAGEECDSGAPEDSATCNFDCTSAVCGDDYVNPMAGELCDDGNTSGGDGCSSDCRFEGALSAGHRHTCAKLDTGSVRCWGYGLEGRLGYGNVDYIGDDETPASAGDVDVGGEVVKVLAGGGQTCALLVGGAVRCWGVNNYGQLGYGNTQNIGDGEPPSAAGDVDVGGFVVQLSVGNLHACAVLDTGGVRCWGNNNYGVLGYGHTDNIGDDETPASVGDVDVGGPVVQVAAGGGHTCALLEQGAVRCWGYNASGQLGYGNTQNIGDDELPSAAGDVDVGGEVVQVVAGFNHTCARLSNGAVRCWGRGNVGQLGYGNPDFIGDDETPASAGDVELGGKILSLAPSPGGFHNCALMAGGAVRCWGRNHLGQLGYGHTASIGDDETPASAGKVDVGGVVTRVVTGDNHTCAVLDTGALRCWGSGLNGRLGYGNTEHIGDDESPASAGDVDVGGAI